MNKQLDIFSTPVEAESLMTASPINSENLKGQNAKVFNYILANGTINMLEAHRIGVMHLHSRISDLRNKNHIRIFDRFIRVNGIDMKEYFF